jgi:hypothetical protein
MFQVVEPMVYLKVPDVGGSYVSYTFYKGAIVPENVEQESLQRHVDEGMVEEIVVPEPKAAPRSRKSE